MSYVTKEQIERAREYDVLDYVLSYESGNVRKVGRGYRLKDHPSVAITSGKWYWHSREFGGKTALDFLTDVRGYGLVDAVCTLLGEQPMGHSRKAVYNAPTEVVEPKSKPPPSTLHSGEKEPPLKFALPRHHKDNNRVIAYLLSRGIDRELIMECIDRGILYESANYHNCVFTGKDERGKTKFAAMRGTTSSFKRDTDGSDKRYSFILPPENPDSRMVAAFESPIDALSHQTLCKQGFIEPFDGWRLSLSGTSLLALEGFLSRNSEVNHCAIFTDNDEAGNKLAAKIMELPHISSERTLPLMGKDWNETLENIKKAERMKNRTISIDKGR